MEITNLENGGRVEKKWGICVSDIHIFSSKDSDEQTQNHLDCITHILKKRDIMVLNGDIFEQENSKYSMQKTIEMAGDFLKKSLEDFPDRKIVYILGNHDCRQQFWDKLEEISKTHPNLMPVKDAYSVGSFRFMHGDREIRYKNPFYKNNDPATERQLLQGDSADAAESKKNVFTKIYNSVEKLIVPIHDSIFHQPRVVSNKILDAYKHVQDKLEGVTTIVSGHVHMKVVDFHVKRFGKEFTMYNTGSPRDIDRYKPLKFILETTFDQDNNIEREDVHITGKQIDKFRDSHEKVRQNKLTPQWSLM